MAHNTRQFPDASTIIGTTTGLAAGLKQIDKDTVKALNGRDGGSFAATTPIVIAGPVQIATTLNFNGGGIYTSSTKHITHGRLDKDDFIQLAAGHSGRSRTLRQWMWPTICAEFNYVSADRNNGSVTTKYPGTRFRSRLRVHDRSTIDSVVVRWEVTYAHANLPGLLPKFRVIRIDSDGKVEPLKSTSGLVLDGFIVLPASYGNVAAYEAGRNPQNSATYTCDQNNVVDIGTYDYAVEIVDEDGSFTFTGGAGNDGNDFHWVSVVCSNILSMAPQ